MQDRKPSMYWIIRAGERIGLESSKSIRQMVAAGTILATDIILREDEQTGHVAVKYFPTLKESPAEVCHELGEPTTVQFQAPSLEPIPSWLLNLPVSVRELMCSFGNRNASALAICFFAILFSMVGATSFLNWLLVRAPSRPTQELNTFALLGGFALQNSDTPEATFARMKKQEESTRRLAELQEADQQKQAAVMVKEGIALMESSKTRAAIDKFNSATRISAKSGDAYLWLARAYAQEKSMPKAIAAYCSAERVALDPSQRELILCELANQYSHEENHSKRLQIIEQLCSEFPQEIEYRLEQAFAARLARDTKKSIEYFESFVADCKDRLTKEQLSDVLLEIVQTHLSNKRIPESLNACERLLSHDPKSAHGRYIRMMIHAENQRPMDALKDYKELRILANSEPWMTEKFVKSLERFSQHGAIIAPLNDLIANGKSDQIGRWYLMRSTAHAHLGNTELAKHDGELAQSNVQFYDSQFRESVAQLNRDVKRMLTDRISYGEILAIRQRPIQFNFDSSIAGRGNQSSRSSHAPQQTEGLYDWLSPGQTAALAAGYGLMPNHGLMRIPR